MLPAGISPYKEKSLVANFLYINFLSPVYMFVHGNQIILMLLSYRFSLRVVDFYVWVLWFKNLLV